MDCIYKNYVLKFFWALEIFFLSKIIYKNLVYEISGTAVWFKRGGGSARLRLPLSTAPPHPQVCATKSDLHGLLTPTISLGQTVKRMLFIDADGK